MDVSQRCLIVYIFVAGVAKTANAVTGTQAMYKSLPFKSASASRWSLHVMKDRMALTLSQVDPGFDLTDDEIKKFKLWPDGIVPYFIDDYSYDKVLRDRIRNFLDITSGLSGLHFQELLSPPQEDKTRWVLFVNRLGLMGCADHTPLNLTNEGVQKVTLGYNCMSDSGELSEAILAIAGVPPQHNAPDRDSYIKVQTENIIPEKRYLFNKVSDTDWLFHELEYDFLSASHFNFHKHTKDGLATIVPINPTEIPVGENNGYSYADILKIRMLYNYISKTKSSNIRAPDCNKIFVPGTEFSNYSPKPKDEIPARQKPNRYLGKPDDYDVPKDDKADDNNNENADGGNDASPDNTNGPDQKNNDEDSVNKNDDPEAENNDGDNPEVKNKKKAENGHKDNKNKALKARFEKKTISPLSVLSDYDTDDQREKIKLKQKYKKKSGHH